MKVPTLKQLAIQNLPVVEEQVHKVYTIRSAIDGEVILQTVPERAEQHLYNDTEGHEHQFSDFSPDIYDNSVIQQRIQEKLDQIKMQPPNLRLMESMVREYSQVFLAKNMKIDVKVSTMHHIETRGEPFKEAPQRLGAKQREILTKEVQNMINVGVIRKSSSPWASRLLVVKKPDGSWRPCVDYRKLNTMTKTDSYPLPYIDDLLFRLGGANIFSKFDLYSGFWQMPLNPSDAEKTAFTTPLGLFEWITMPFCLKNAPASFQRMMDEVLHEAVTMGYCMVYMDDIVVFSKTEQEHIEHVRRVFQLIDQANLRMKIEKCDFAQAEIELLGFTVSASGLTPFAHKCKAITEVQVAHTVRGIQSFLGLIRYYQRFVPQLSKLSQPLTDLLKKGRNPKTDWGIQHDQAIECIKQAFVSPEMLVNFDPNKQIVLHTDASDYALGAVLSHVDDDGEERPICYASKTLDKHQRNYTVTEKECLAVVWATELWRTLLLGKEFVVETDHAALRQILMDKTSTGRLARWALKLQEFDFWVKYRKGEENGNADFLSRVQQAGDLYSVYGIKMEARELTKDFLYMLLKRTQNCPKNARTKVSHGLHCL